MSKIDLGPEAHNFHVGQPVVMASSDGGATFYRLTGWRLLSYRIRERAHHWTRWWRPRAVVAAVDVAEGSITLVVERWSWRRWRWERVA